MKQDIIAMGGSWFGNTISGETTEGRGIDELSDIMIGNDYNGI